MCVRQVVCSGFVGNKEFVEVRNNLTSPWNIVRMTAGANRLTYLCKLQYDLALEYSQDDGRCQLVYVMLCVMCNR